MKKIKFILMVLSIPLLVSCVKCISGYCEESPQESKIYFRNAQKYGISLADFSLSKEHPLTEHECFSIEEINWQTFFRHNGVEVLKEIEQRFANERDPSVHGEHFLLFMNSNKEVVLAWDLRDTTQRWADESLWTMDSSTRVVCCDHIQTQYFNVYHFSDEDFEAQQ